MAIYYYFPTKDTTIYEENTSQNTGKDEILELVKYTSGSSRRDESGAVYSNTFNSRILLQFNYANLSASIVDGTIPTFSTGSTTSASAFMNLYVSQENAITDSETIAMLPLSMSGGQGAFVEGFGREKSLNESGLPISEEGATWINSDRAGNVTWNTLRDGTVNNNWSTNSGGGTWHSNYAYSGSQDLSSTSGDLSIDITNGVGAHLDGTLINEGWIIKRTDINETNNGRFGSHKYFSIDTHTIYAPRLCVKWDDSSHEPGTLPELTHEDILVYPKNNRGEYPKDSREKIRVMGRERFPVKTFATSSDYSTVKYLPTSSYYAIKDVQTEEYIIDFDTNYTKISCDSEGNYFDFYLDGLQPERYYKFVFRVDRGFKKQYFDEDFVFKVVR